MTAILGFGGPAVGPAPAQEATVRLAVVAGRVLDQESGKPVDGVQVRLVGEEEEFEGRTDDLGVFLFARVPRGFYELLLEHLAYGTRADTIEIKGQEMVNLELRLTMEPIVLAPLVVSVRRRHMRPTMQEFYVRMEQGQGRYINRMDIERRKPGRITHMIADVGGISMARASGESSLAQKLYFRRHQRFIQGQAVPCWPTVYLDGRRIQEGGVDQGARDPFEIDIDELVLPGDVEGVEVYSGAGGLPPRFGGSFGGCGVIAIWTRSSL